MTAVTNIICSWLGTRFMRLPGFLLLLRRRLAAFAFSSRSIRRVVADWLFRVRLTRSLFVELPLDHKACLDLPLRFCGDIFHRVEARVEGNKEMRTGKARVVI